MDTLDELYQQVIIDHGRRPRHVGVCDDVTHQHEGFNPFCGDELTLYLRINTNRVIDAITFIGAGCAISTASVSLLIELLEGKTVDEARELFGLFKTMIVDGSTGEDYKPLKKCRALAGVKAYPMRVKCATLAWHTMIAAVEGEKGKGGAVTTE